MATVEHQVHAKRKDTTVILKCAACGHEGRVPAYGRWQDGLNVFLDEHRMCPAEQT